MVILELHSQNIKTKYKGYLCSKTTIIVWVIMFIKIAVPFIFCYSTQGFWLKNQEFCEQPDLRFKGEYLFIGHTNNASFPIICSNFNGYQERNNQDNCILIKVREIDLNYDGKIDEFSFKMILALPRNISILSLDLLLPINYRLHTICSINTETMILIQDIVNTFMNVMNVTSVLKLSQKSSLLCYSNNDDDDTLDRSKNTESPTFFDVMHNYNKCNITTYLSDTYKTFAIQRIDRFEINLNVMYPEHKIYYRAGLLQILKWAWIQYISIYIVFSWLTKKIKNHIFDNRFVLFYKISPIKGDS